jgi:hypothetical protein
MAGLRPGHPRLTYIAKNVDGWNKSGHDEGMNHVKENARRIG